MRIREDVAVGHQLQLAMRQTNLFPNMVVQMVAIGEEAGSLDKMLFKVAEFYEQEVNNAVDALASLLEPFIMIIIGVVVSGMVVGMSPIFSSPRSSADRQPAGFSARVTGPMLSASAVIALAGVLGLLVGSFLNVVILRLPAAECTIGGSRAVNCWSSKLTAHRPLRQASCVSRRTALTASTLSVRWTIFRC
jgi:hypothetical protein